MKRAALKAFILLAVASGCEGFSSDGAGADGGPLGGGTGSGQPSTGGGTSNPPRGGGGGGGGIGVTGGGSGAGTTGGGTGDGDSQTKCTLTLTVSGSGTTDPAAGTHTYPPGTKVTVTAKPATGATFTGWSGAATGTTNPLVLTGCDVALTATFTAAPRPARFTNPTLWEDAPDVDVLRVDDVYYFTASNMHYSPGAPIFRSYDLVNWEAAGHAVPVLNFGKQYDLNGGQAYIGGTWASFLGYRKSNKTFYWGGCVGFAQTHIYTATDVAGPWTEHPAIPTCYYDCGLLIDDDDTMYVSYGSTTIKVAQLAPDGFSQVKTQDVFNNGEYIEGSHMYKVKGAYYIIVTQPASKEYVLKSSGGPFGPYTMRPLVQGVRPPVSGAGNPHQGGIVQTQKGDWYYMAFIDAYPGGRVPVLAPITWSADGWPTVNDVASGWAQSYPFPDVPPSPKLTKPLTGRESFSDKALGHDWEWNHNPDNSKWSTGDGLTLQTATVTDDLYRARNTLTHRILGPTSTATIELDYRNMKDGDRAGLVLLRDASAWIGVKRDAEAYRLSMVTGLTMDKSWNTTGKGSESAGTTVSGGHIWLRLAADIQPGTGKKAVFSYSTDGTTFTTLGAPFVMGNDWAFFPGHRFGVFNYATKALGGSVKVSSFELTTP